MTAPWRRGRPAAVVLLEAGHGRALAWGTTAAGDPVIATAEALVIGPDGSAGAAVIPWHLVERASWEQPVLTLRHRGSGAVASLLVELQHVGGLPPVVRERVTRTILISRRVELRGGLGAVIAGRRGPDGAIAWTVTFDPGLDARDAALQAQARSALAELRQSYGA